MCRKNKDGINVHHPSKEEFGWLRKEGRIFAAETIIIHEELKVLFHEEKGCKGYTLKIIKVIINSNINVIAFVTLVYAIYIDYNNVLCNWYTH